MNKEKLVKFVYVLLRDSLTFGDMDMILDEVEQEGNGWQIPLVQTLAEQIVERLTKSNLKCSENMCNTEYDDVQVVKKAVFSGSGINERTDIVDVALCADCRKREANLIVVAG